MQVRATCVDATWISLIETALESHPPVFGGLSSAMRRGAVGSSSSCVHHVARGSGKDEDGARCEESGERCGAEAGVEDA